MLVTSLTNNENCSNRKQTHKTTPHHCNKKLSRCHFIVGYNNSRTILTTSSQSRSPPHQDSSSRTLMRIRRFSLGPTHPDYFIYSNPFCHTSTLSNPFLFCIRVYVPGKLLCTSHADLCKLTVASW